MRRNQNEPTILTVTRKLYVQHARIFFHTHLSRYMTDEASSVPENIIVSLRDVQCAQTMVPRLNYYMKAVVERKCITSSIKGSAQVQIRFLNCHSDTHRREALQEVYTLIKTETQTLDDGNTHNVHTDFVVTRRVIEKHAKVVCDFFKNFSNVLFANEISEIREIRNVHIRTVTFTDPQQYKSVVDGLSYFFRKIADENLTIQLMDDGALRIKLNSKHVDMGQALEEVHNMAQLVIEPSPDTMKERNLGVSGDATDQKNRPQKKQKVEKDIDLNGEEIDCEINMAALTPGEDLTQILTWDTLWKNKILDQTISSTVANGSCNAIPADREPSEEEKDLWFNNLFL